MSYEGWTYDEKRKHEQGRALMQSARDSRRNRVEAEKQRVARQMAAQKAADERAAREQDDKIAAFMDDFASILGKHNVTLVTLQQTTYVGQSLPLFKLVSRDIYKAPEYLISVQPGRGFNWKK